MAAHQDHRLVAERQRQILADRRVADQHVGLTETLSDIPHRRAGRQKRRVVEYRAQRDLADRVRNDAGRMGVDNRHDVRPRPVDFAVDETL